MPPFPLSCVRQRNVPYSLSPPNFRHPASRTKSAGGQFHFCARHAPRASSALCVCRLWCDSRRCLCRRGRGARRGVSSTGFRTLTGYRGAAWNTGIPTTLHVDSTRLAFLCTPSHRISIYITIYKFWWRHRGVVCMCVPPSELGLYHCLESAHLSPIYKSCTSFKLSRWELALPSLALPSHIGVL